MVAYERHGVDVFVFVQFVCYCLPTQRMSFLLRVNTLDYFKCNIVQILLIYFFYIFDWLISYIEMIIAINDYVLILYGWAYWMAVLCSVHLPLCKKRASLVIQLTFQMYNLKDGSIKSTNWTLFLFVRRAFMSFLSQARLQLPATWPVKKQVL